MLCFLKLGGQYAKAEQAAMTSFSAPGGFARREEERLNAYRYV